MNKKKKLIIAGVAILMVAVVLILIFTKRETIFISTEKNQNQYEPEFMTSQEKTEFKLPQDSKIQVLKREDDGSVDVYKIIRSDNDIIYNLDEVVN